MDNREKWLKWDKTLNCSIEKIKISSDKKRPKTNLVKIDPHFEEKPNNESIYTKTKLCSSSKICFKTIQLLWLT